MPVIFYGDETGLKGQNDPACRKSMPWNRLDDKRIKTTQDTLALRQSFPVLKDGTFSHIVFSDDLYGIIRENSQSRVLVVFNRGKTDQDIDVSDLGIVSTELHLQENRIHMKAGTFQIMRIQERMVSETSKT
jgi:glycosidase